MVNLCTEGSYQDSTEGRGLILIMQAIISLKDRFLQLFKMSLMVKFYLLPEQNYNSFLAISAIATTQFNRLSQVMKRIPCTGWRSIVISHRDSKKTFYHSAAASAVLKCFGIFKDGVRWQEMPQFFTTTCSDGISDYSLIEQFVQKNCDSKKYTIRNIPLIKEISSERIHLGI